MVCVFSVLQFDDPPPTPHPTAPTLTPTSSPRSPLETLVEFNVILRNYIVFVKSITIHSINKFIQFKPIDFLNPSLMFRCCSRVYNIFCP